jgi:hypothetical protein
MFGQTQKADQVADAHETIRVLDNNARTGLEYLFTGAESEMHSDQFEQVITDTVEGIPKIQFLSVFRAWLRRLE